MHLIFLGLAWYERKGSKYFFKVSNKCLFILYEHWFESSSLKIIENFPFFSYIFSHLSLQHKTSFPACVIHFNHFVRQFFYAGKLTHMGNWMKKKYLIHYILKEDKNFIKLNSSNAFYDFFIKCYTKWLNCKANKM